MASRDTPSDIIVLSGGLDLVTPKLAAQPGTLQDCLNFEVAYRSGYRSIDGFTRYDGLPVPERAQIYALLDRYASASDPSDPAPSGTFQVNEPVIYRYICGYGDGVFLYNSIKGYCIEAPSFNVPTPDATVTTGKFYFGEIPMPAKIPSWVTATAIITVQIIGLNSGAIASNNVPTTASFSTLGEYNSLINDSFSTHRANIKELPGGPAMGMHWFNDRLHAVVESVTYEYESGTAVALDIPGQKFPQAIVISDVTPPVSFQPNGWILSSTANGSAPNVYGKAEILAIPSADIEAGGYIRALTTMNLRDAQFLGGAATQVVGQESGYEGIIRVFNIEAGSISDSTASGVAYVETAAISPVPLPTPGEQLQDLFAQHIAYVESSSGVSLTNTDAFQLVGDSEKSDGVLVAANKTGGWSALNMGHEIRFDTGTNKPVTIYEAGGTIDEIEITDTGDTSPLAGEDVNDGVVTTPGWTLVGGATDLVDAVSAADTKYAQTSLTAANITSQWLKYTDFRFLISNLSSVIGVEVTVRMQRTATNTISLAGIQLALPGGNFSASRGAGTALSTTMVDYTFGSASDNWGVSIAPNDVNSEEFGLRLRMKAPSSGTFPAVAQVDQVLVKIHYRTGTTDVWLRKGGSDIATAELVYAYQDGGEWANDDAEGIMTMRNISDSSLVESGMEIRTEAGGGGALIAVTTSGAEPLRLPSKQAIDEVGSKYRFFESNFFAAPWLEAVYGVSGAGHAFTFNNDYMFKIRTGSDDDRPRHVSRVADQLALGYSSGSVDLSAEGLPDLFDGEAGAQTTGFGEPIVGLLPLSGRALGVWTNRSIHALIGNDLQQQVISPSSGAIEYTVTDMGIPVFLDFRGIGTVTATDRYGDFRAGRLSEMIHPYLLPRVQGLRINSAEPVSVIDVEVFRNKNQYRVYWSDGYILTATVSGENAPPEFTIQKYWLTDSAVPLIPEVVVSGTTPEGQDRVFASFVGQPYVYELDRGNSFDGNAISGYFVLNPAFMNRPDIDKRVNTVHVDGIIEGPASLALSATSDYGDPSSLTAQDNITAASTNAQYREVPYPFFSIGELDGEGRDHALRIDYNSATDSPVTVQTISYIDAATSGARSKLR